MHRLLYHRVSSCRTSVLLNQVHDDNQGTKSEPKIFGILDIFLENGNCSPEAIDGRNKKPTHGVYQNVDEHDDPPSRRLGQEFVLVQKQLLQIPDAINNHQNYTRAHDLREFGQIS